MQAVGEMENNSEQYNGMLPHTSLEKTIKIIHQKQLLPLKSSDCFLLQAEQKVGSKERNLVRRVWGRFHINKGAAII